MEFDAKGAEFVGEGEAFFAPFSEIGRARDGVGGAREKEVSDFQVADGATEVGGSGVEFAAEEHRGFTGFVRGA